MNGYSPVVLKRIPLVLREGFMPVGEVAKDLATKRCVVYAGEAVDGTCEGVRAVMYR